MRYCELYELFDKQAEWKLVKTNVMGEFYNFEIDDKVYEVSIGPVDTSKYELAFSSPTGMGVTGEGNAYVVFSTVAAILLQFISKHTPEVFYFASNVNEPSRVKLYKRMAKAIVAKTGYKLDVQDKYGELFFYFVKQGAMLNGKRIEGDRPSKQ